MQKYVSTRALPWNPSAFLQKSGAKNSIFENYYHDLAEAFPPGTPPDPSVIAEIQRRYDTFPPVTDTE
jgi:hypothetical protein